MRKFLSCLSCLAAAIVFTSSPNAQAQKAPPVYAVLSLVGDQLDVVVASSYPDMNFAPYRRAMLAIDTPMFDDGVVAAAGIAIHNAVPNAELAALRTRSAVLFEKQASLFEENGGSIAVPAAIKAAVKQQNAGYLLLVTKHRADLKLRFDNKRRDSGTLEGLGFYVDDSAQSGLHERGFIAPYAYLRVALIDASNWNVISQQTIIASSAMPVISAIDAPTQWGRMSAQEKAQSVDKLLRTEIARVVPLLLKSG